MPGNRSAVKGREAWGTEWAIALVGRADVGAVVMRLEDRDEAESIAQEIRSHGHSVEVRPLTLLDVLLAARG